MYISLHWKGDYNYTSNVEHMCICIQFFVHSAKLRVSMHQPTYIPNLKTMCQLLVIYTTCTSQLTYLDGE